jgi:hypothetical protein
MSSTADAALEYFRTANAIVAFHVVQTPIFLFTVYRDPHLLDSLARAKEWYILGSIAIAIVYVAAIAGCGRIETQLWRAGGDVAVASQTRGAAIGRVAVVVCLALGCALVLGFMKKPPI